MNLELSAQVSLLRGALQKSRVERDALVGKAQAQGYREGYDRGLRDGAGWAIKKVVTAAWGLSYEPESEGQ